MPVDGGQSTARAGTRRGTRRLRPSPGPGGTGIKARLVRLVRPCLFAILAVLAAGGGWVAWRAWLDPDIDLVGIHHLPAVYDRRAGGLTANVTGYVSRFTAGADYRLNDGPWRPVPHDVWPRLSPREFTIELAAADLADGENRLSLRADSILGRHAELERVFVYDPSPPLLPVTVGWQGRDLEAQDGEWEAVEIGGEWRVRPRPGSESYDRLLQVVGAFPGGRRVETDVTFHGSTGDGHFGFGVLPMWGGHVDDGDVAPRRGWAFGLAWYYSRYRGVAGDFSYKMGDGAEAWAGAYRSLRLEEGRRYRVVVEVRPVLDVAGNHAAYALRMKWWPADEPEPVEWVKVADHPGAALPEGEYGVALLAVYCRADFGPVHVVPLQPLRHQVGVVLAE